MYKPMEPSSSCRKLARVCSALSRLLTNIQARFSKYVASGSTIVIATASFVFFFFAFLITFVFPNLLPVVVCLLIVYYVMVRQVSGGTKSYSLFGPASSASRFHTMPAHGLHSYFNDDLERDVWTAEPIEAVLRRRAMQVPSTLPYIHNSIASFPSLYSSCPSTPSAWSVMDDYGHWSRCDPTLCQQLSAAAARGVRCISYTHNYQHCTADLQELVEVSTTRGTTRRLRTEYSYGLRMLTPPNHEHKNRASVSCAVPGCLTAAWSGGYCAIHQTWSQTLWSTRGNPATSSPLAEGTMEFERVVCEFYKTMPKSKWRVTKLERVENKERYDAFQHFKSRLRGPWQWPWHHSHERLLFHGTAHANIPLIVTEGVDFRLRGTSTGSAYGQGAYFARDAVYSHGYCSSVLPSPEPWWSFKWLRGQHPRWSMFAVVVLLDDVAPGDPTIVRPPKNANTGTECSCTVNDIDDPSIFVVYHNEQLYVAYVITYEAG